MLKIKPESFAGNKDEKNHMNFYFKSKLWHTCTVIVIITISTLLLTGKLYAEGQYDIMDSFGEVHGIIAQEYYDYEKDGNNSGITSFSNRYAYLVVNSKIQENIEGVIELKMNQGGKDINIDRCLIDWNYNKKLGLIIGKFYHDILFDVNRYRPVENKMVSSYLHSEMVDMIVLRDVGLAVYGEYPLIGIKTRYKLAVANGAMLREMQINAETGSYSFENFGKDVDRKKAVMGVLSIWPVDKLRIFGSYFNTKNDQLITTTTLTPSVVPGVDVVTDLRTEADNISLEVVSAYMQLKLNKIELFFGGLGVEEKQSGVGRFLLVNSYTGELVHNILREKLVSNMELVLRYNYYECITSGMFSGIFGKKEDNYHVGINISPYEHFIFKAEYRWVEEIGGPDLDNDGFLLQVVMDF